MEKVRFSGAMALLIRATGSLDMPTAKGNLSIRLVIFTKAPFTCLWLMEIMGFLQTPWVTYILVNGSSTENMDKESKYGARVSQNMRVPIPTVSARALEPTLSKARLFTRVNGTEIRCTALANTAFQMGAPTRVNSTGEGFRDSAS